MAIRNPIVAIVDDDASVRTGVQRFLRSAGLIATTFKTGADFLASLEAAVPDCVILDVVMPEMTGPAVLAQMRAAGVYVPVIFISAGEPVGVNAANPDGPAAFLQKPFDGDRLIDVIRQSIGESGP